MKKILFALCTLTLFITSCSQEELFESSQQGSYENLLIQKSKEFAKKYNIDLAIDKNALSNLEHVYTIEEMEDFYRALSECSALGTSYINWNSEKEGKLKIKRRISLGEAAVTPNGSASAEFNFRLRSIINDTIVYHPFLNIKSTISWEQPMAGHGGVFYENGSSSIPGKLTYRGKRVISGNFRGDKVGVADCGFSVPLPPPYKSHTFHIHLEFEQNEANWSISPSSINDSIHVAATGTYQGQVIYKH